VSLDFANFFEGPGQKPIRTTLNCNCFYVSQVCIFHEFALYFFNPNNGNVPDFTLAIFCFGNFKEPLVLFHSFSGLS
jgi:hypothetical protein